MKKILYMMGLVLLMTSCGSDKYEDWAEPMANGPEDAQSVTLAVSPASAIDYANLTAEEVQLFVPTVTSTQSGTTSYDVVISNADNSKSARIIPDGKGFVSSEDLKSIVETLYGKAPKPRLLNLAITAYTLINGQSIANKAATTLNVTLTAPKISQNYYVVGGTLDWAASAASKAQKFSHSDVDVYDDPIFTIVIPASSGDTWFAIGDDEACEAIGNGDWSKLFGVKGESTDMMGNFDYRYNLGGDHSFCVPAGTGAFLQITINMMEYSYTITPVASQFYMVGALPGWSADGAKTAILYPQSSTKMSYTSKFTGAWDLKLWNKNDIGNWDAAYGCIVDGDNSPSGTIINSKAQAISAPSAEFYTFTFDLSSMTYTWTKLDNQNPTEYSAVGVIGDFNGWGGDLDMTQVTPHNWYAVGTVTDGGLKFRANHDWGINWGADLSVTDANFYGQGVGNGPNIYVPAGTYAFYLNDITGEFAIVAQ